MGEQFMQILQSIGPEAMLIIIQTLASLSPEKLQQLIVELQNMIQQGAQQAPPEGAYPEEAYAAQQGYGPPETQEQVNANLFGGGGGYY